MVKQTLIFVFLLLVVLNAKADVGNFDVIELSDGKSMIYVTIWSPGILKNHDLCYYDWDGNYVDEVQNRLLGSVDSSDSLAVYSRLVKFNLKELNISDELDSILFILKNQFRISKNELFEKYQIIDAYRGNTAGFVYTETITNEDNIWVADYDTEELFSLADDGLCGMSMYGIRHNISQEEKNILKKELEEILKEDKWDRFNDRLNELHKRNILMIGFCSC